MKHSRFFCIVAFLWIAADGRSEAGWHGGGGGGWGGRGGFYGGGVVIVTPYYYPPYPYYYGAPYYNGYYGGSAYYGGETGTGSIATAVQQQLSRMGYYKGPIDGIVGSGTRAAISAYQRNHAMAESGTIDTPLLRALRL